MSETQIQLTDLDRRIWEEELEPFVPRRVFDIHTHLFRWDFNTSPDKEKSELVGMMAGTPDAPHATWAALEACDAALLPGREVHRLSFPFPFEPSCDFAASNRFVREQTADDPASAALMIVHPSMTEDFLEGEIIYGGHLGFKPYRFYSQTGDAVQCRITDFLPEHQLRVADRHGLLVMLHLSRRQAIADPQNQADLLRLTETYPNVRWILAHCARSYSDWVVRRGASTLRKLPNVWFDVSSVCEADAMVALLKAVGVERVMYGSDDLPVGFARGKYVTFGYAWAFLSETNHQLGLSHCDGRMTFVRYEQLRAMRRATASLGYGPEQIARLFATNAEELIQSVRRNV